MAYECGNSGYVEVGAVRLDVTSWDGEESDERQDTTNTGSAGYYESLGCKKKFTGTINADFDTALGPKAAPDITAGDQVALELHTAGAESYTMTADVTQLRWTVPAGAKISYSFAFESNGAYVYA